MEPVATQRVFSNRYELTHLIARGGMAQVYRAHDRLLDRPVALKVLFPELSVDRAFVERFRREAQAAANLSHPNIVPVFDWGEDSGTYFIVMEFVDGRPLSALLRATGPLDGVRAADIGAPVAAALSYAHRHGVVHRDVKPGNVLITDDGQVKVTDFGIARAVNTEESLTQTGAVMGTAAYFSPEQAEGLGVDARSDIYSLGVVLFEMVTGRTPFLGDSPVAVASKHVRDQPPLPRSLNPAVPPALEAVIMKAMAKSPVDRYATAEDLRADLLRFADGRPVTAHDPALTGGQTAYGATQSVDAVTRTQAIPITDMVMAEDLTGDDVRSKTGRLAAILVTLLVALAVVVFFLLRALGVFSASNTFAMPSVAGQSVSSATAVLVGKGLVVGGTKPVTSTRPVNTVTATNPAAGATVKKGQSVTLSVSEGPVIAKVSVPDVQGQQLIDAETTLQNDNLNPRVKFVSSSEPENTVVSQSPAANTKVKSGSTVVLTVPQPQNTVSVPNVVGISPVQAASAIGGAGLTVGNNQTSQCSSTVGNGLVASTSPAVGTSVAKNSSVNLVVSTGPCQIVIQNVQGDDPGTATTTLSGQGLSVSQSTTMTCPTSENNTVIAQSPEPGTSVSNGSTVTITVCNNAPPPTSSTTSTTLAGPGGGPLL